MMAILFFIVFQATVGFMLAFHIAAHQFGDHFFAMIDGEYY